MCKDCKVVMARRTYSHGKCEGLKKRDFDIVTPDGSKGSVGYKKLNTWRDETLPHLVYKKEKKNETESDTRKVEKETEDLEEITDIELEEDETSSARARPRERSNRNRRRRRSASSSSSSSSSSGSRSSSSSTSSDSPPPKKRKTVEKQTSAENNKTPKETKEPEKTSNDQKEPKKEKSKPDKPSNVEEERKTGNKTSNDQNSETKETNETVDNDPEQKGKSHKETESAVRNLLESMESEGESASSQEATMEADDMMQSQASASASENSERYNFIPHTPTLDELEKDRRDRVILQVGDSRFLSSKRTLTSIPNSLLAEVCQQPSVNPKFRKTDSQAYYFDRDATHFRHILNYLRNGGNLYRETLPRQKDQLYELWAEARYYRLPGLETAIHRRLGWLQNVQLSWRV